MTINDTGLHAKIVSMVNALIPSTTHEYIFILGRAGELCLAEAKAIIEQYSHDYKIVFSSSEILHFTVSNELPIRDLIETLGGTIKIAKVMVTIPGADMEKIAVMAEELLSKRIINGKILFGISIYNSGKLLPAQIAEAIKENLRKRDISSRYVVNGREPLTSVQVVKHGLQEIILLVEEENVVLGKRWRFRILRTGENGIMVGRKFIRTRGCCRRK